MSTPFHVYTRQQWDARTARPRENQDTPREAFVHHTEDSNAGAIETLSQAFGAMRRIQDFHMDERGWSDIGYHFVIFQPRGRHPQGIVCHGRPVEYEPAAQLDHNMRTLAIAVYGNGDHDGMLQHTRYLIEALVRSYGPEVHKVGGHRDVVATDCPGEHFYAAVPQIARALGVEHF